MVKGSSLLRNEGLKSCLIEEVKAVSLGVGQHLDKTRGCKIPLVVFLGLVFEQALFSERSGDNEGLFGENLC